jgi:hypothetical protein
MQWPRGLAVFGATCFLKVCDSGYTPIGGKASAGQTRRRGSAVPCSGHSPLAVPISTHTDWPRLVRGFFVLCSPLAGRRSGAAGFCRQKPGHFSNIGLPSRLATAKLPGSDNCGVLFNASRCRKASEPSGPDRYRSNDLARPIFHRPMRGAGLVACGCRSRAVRQCSSSSPGIRFNRRSRHPPLYCGMAATQSNGFEIQIDIR